MFKLVKDDLSGKVNSVKDIELNAFIPFDPANVDFQQFKTDVLGGAELQDAEGNVMTQEEATAFIGTLP